MRTVAFPSASWHRELMKTAPADPGLRHRIPLYPGQFLSALTLASLGPLLDAMMNDLGVPLRHGGVIMAALFAGTATGIVLFWNFAANRLWTFRHVK